MLVVNTTVYMFTVESAVTGILCFRYRKAWLHLGFACKILPFFMVTYIMSNLFKSLFW